MRFGNSFAARGPFTVKRTLASPGKCRLACRWRSDQLFHSQTHVFDHEYRSAQNHYYQSDIDVQIVGAGGHSPGEKSDRSRNKTGVSICHELSLPAPHTVIDEQQRRIVPEAPQAGNHCGQPTSSPLTLAEWYASNNYPRPAILVCSPLALPVCFAGAFRQRVRDRAILGSTKPWLSMAPHPSTHQPEQSHGTEIPHLQGRE